MGILLLGRLVQQEGSVVDARPDEECYSFQSSCCRKFLLPIIFFLFFFALYYDYCLVSFCAQMGVLYLVRNCSNVVPLSPSRVLNTQA